jgi:hypothetical protein
MFGRNPELTFNNLSSIARSTAEANGVIGADMTALDSILNNKVKPMLDVVMHRNPMDANSIWGAVVTSAANITTSAVLGSASLAAATGDFATTAMVKAFSGMPMFTGMGEYFKTIATDKKFMRVIANQSGFIHEQSVNSMYSATRFNPITSVGPAWSRRVADLTIRASLLTAHTTAARWSTQMEFMGFMHRLKGSDFNNNLLNPIMSRYGITSDDWDIVRGLDSWSPNSSVEPFLRPIDILKSGVPNAQELYYKFQSMVLQESKYAVPDSTIEASVALKGGSRPDTLAGTILHSFAMFKNFPLTFYNTYGRLGIATSETNKGRLGFYGALGAAVTGAGVLAVQMNEIRQGRDPIPFDDWRLYGKGFMKGGGAGLWGDFLFASSTAFGQGPEDVAAGPLMGVFGDATSLIFKNAQKATEGEDTKVSEDLVKFARRYTPGSNLWYANLALQRGFWDAMEDIADPKAQQKRNTKMRKQKKDYGNDYFWPLGQSTPSRAPQLNED